MLPHWLPHWLPHRLPSLLKLALATLTTLLLATPVIAAEITLPGSNNVVVEGARFASQEKVADGTLTLNGAGVKGKWFIRVYAIGLYLPKKTSDANEAVSQAGPKRLKLVPLMDLTGEQFADALEKNFSRSLTESELKTVEDDFNAFNATVKALTQLPKGSNILIDWLPQTGTRLTTGGKQQGKDIPGDAFYRAMLKIWLGDNAGDDTLRAAMLGKPIQKAATP